MSIFVTSRGRFRWPGFTKAVKSFAVAHGLEEALPVVDDGRVVFWRDHDDLLEDRDDLEAIPGDPLERLKAGLTLFASFTAYQDSRRVACADGGVIAVPDIEADDGGGPLPLATDELRRLAEKTECDECKCYGFLISFDAGRLTLQTALVADANGECHVEGVVEAGLLDEPMAKFIRRFARRR